MAVSVCMHDMLQASTEDANLFIECTFVPIVALRNTLGDIKE